MGGIIFTHIYDFIMAGTEEFLNDLEKEIRKVLNVSKVEKNKFRFAGIDIKRKDYRIKMSMKA